MEEGEVRRPRRRIRKRRRGPGNRQNANEEGQEDEDDRAPPMELVAAGGPPDTAAARGPRYRRIIERSARTARAEEELRKALIVLIVGELAELSVDGLASEIARRYDLPVELLQLHALSPGEALIVLPDEATAERVYNNGRPLQLPPYTLSFRRWSRLRNASAVVLPSLVEVELGGIPAHVWEKETAEHLLGEWCWVRKLHAGMLNRQDYPAFRLQAWCTEPELIPGDMELVVMEPLPPVEEQPPCRRALSYDVSVKVQRVQGGFGSPDDSPPPPPRSGGDRSDQSRRQRNTSVPEPAAPSGEVAGGQRVPVHRRLGPTTGPASERKVASQDSAAAFMSLEPDASQSPTVPSPEPEVTQPESLSWPKTIDDQATSVIMPRFGADEEIPEIAGHAGEMCNPLGCPSDQTDRRVDEVQTQVGCPPALGSEAADQPPQSHRPITMQRGLVGWRGAPPRRASPSMIH